MIKPVESSIPDPLRQAISLSDKYDTYVETSIRDTIKKGELQNKIKRRHVCLSQNISSTFLNGLYNKVCKIVSRNIRGVSKIQQHTSINFLVGD